MIFNTHPPVIAYLGPSTHTDTNTTTSLEVDFEVSDIDSYVALVAIQDDDNSANDLFKFVEPGLSSTTFSQNVSLVAGENSFMAVAFDTAGNIAQQVISILYNCTDCDGDGYNSPTDCDDNDPTVNPAANEIYYNDKDDDCDAAAIDNDQDADGYDINQDCDDVDSSVNPGVSEIPYNGKDDDCNAATLDNDLDGDGYDSPTDCNDGDGSINPGVSEAPGNGSTCTDTVDNNCNSRIDLEEPACLDSVSNTRNYPIKLGAYDGDETCSISPEQRSFNGNKYLSITIRENDDWVDDLSLKIELTVPCGLNYNLYLYDDGSIIASSTNSGSGTESITHIWGDTYFVDDTEYFVIEVRYISGSTYDPWTLKYWPGCK